VNIDSRKLVKAWERTLLANLVVTNGRYYARAFGDGKELWNPSEGVLKASQLKRSEASDGEDIRARRWDPRLYPETSTPCHLIRWPRSPLGQLPPPLFAK
jgi:hypothetical protein